MSRRKVVGVWEGSFRPAGRRPVMRKGDLGKGLLLGHIDVSGEL